MKKTDRMFAMLQDIITHFSENPYAKRSIGKIKSYTYGCLYNPPKEKPESIGCAIGMYLDTDTAKRFDRMENSSISTIFKKHNDKLPKWMQELDESFLIRCQVLHDSNRFWDDNGLTKDGKEHVKGICELVKLPYDELVF